MKKYEVLLPLISAVFLTVILSGCMENTQAACKGAYISTGDSCCLDVDGDNVCDPEPTSTTSTTTSTSTTSTTTSTSTSTTTTSTATTSTTTTTILPALLECGKKYCVVGYLHGDCTRYGKISMVCLNETTVYFCEDNTTHPCAEGTVCRMGESGGHCRA